MFLRVYFTFFITLLTFLSLSFALPLTSCNSLGFMASGDYDMLSDLTVMSNSSNPTPFACFNIISSSDISINCNGNTIHMNTQVISGTAHIVGGFNIQNSDNITIENCNFNASNTTPSVIYAFNVTNLQVRDISASEISSHDTVFFPMGEHISPFLLQLVENVSFSNIGLDKLNGTGFAIGGIPTVNYESRNIEIEGFTITNHYSDSLFKGIYLGGDIDNISFRNVNLDGNSDLDGIKINGEDSNFNAKVTNSIFENLELSNYNDGVEFIDVENSSFSNIELDLLSGEALSLVTGDGKNLYFNNINITNSNAILNSVSILSGINFENFIFENITSRGVFIRTNTNDVRFNNGILNNFASHGFFNLLSPRNITYSNLIITNISDRTFNLEGIDIVLENITISNHSTFIYSDTTSNIVTNVSLNNLRELTIGANIRFDHHTNLEFTNSYFSSGVSVHGFVGGFVIFENITALRGLGVRGFDGGYLRNIEILQGGLTLADENFNYFVNNVSTQGLIMRESENVTVTNFSITRSGLDITSSNNVTLSSIQLNNSILGLRLLGSNSNLNFIFINFTNIIDESITISNTNENITFKEIVIKDFGDTSIVIDGNSNNVHFFDISIYKPLDSGRSDTGINITSGSNILFNNTYIENATTALFANSFNNLTLSYSDFSNTNISNPNYATLNLNDGSGTFFMNFLGNEFNLFGNLNSQDYIFNSTIDSGFNVGNYWENILCFNLTRAGPFVTCNSPESLAGVDFAAHAQTTHFINYLQTPNGTLNSETISVSAIANFTVARCIFHLSNTQIDAIVTNSTTCSITTTASFGNTYNYFLEFVSNESFSLFTSPISITMVDPNPPSTNNKKSSNSGGSSNRGGSSVVNNRGLTNESFCESILIPQLWSTCSTSNSQWRLIIDAKACESSIVRNETRECRLNNSELENLYLNSKEFSLSKIRSRYYEADLGDDNYKEIFYTTTKLLGEDEGKPIVIVDSTTQIEYLANPLDEEGGKYYYILEEIDSETLQRLKDQGIIPTPFLERLGNLSDSILESQSFRVIINVLLVMFVVVLLFFTIFLIKKHHKKPLPIQHKEESTILKMNSIDDTTSHQIGQLKEYVHRYHLQASKKELRDKLLNVGWREEVVDEVLRSEDIFKTQNH